MSSKIEGWDDLRPEIQEFALEMERAMRANDHKGREVTHRDPADFWREKIAEEYEELEVEITGAMDGVGDLERLAREAVDVANVAMMLRTDRDCFVPKGDGSAG